MFPGLGVAYIADGTGHGDSHKRERLGQFWNGYNQAFVTEHQKLELFQGREQVEAFLKERIWDLNKTFTAKVKTSSTFSLAMLVKINGEKYVASVHTGDSSLWHVKHDGVDLITYNDGFELGLMKDSSIFFDIRKVQEGDRIIGLTDGITDFIPKDILDGILMDGTTAENLLSKLKEEIERLAKDHQHSDLGGVDPVKGEPLKILDSENINSSDDICAFMMEVPRDLS